MAPPANPPMRIDMRVEGGRALLAGFRALPKEASAELRESALRLSTLLAQRVAAAGQAEGGQAAVLAQTVKARKDRIPSFTVGGTKRLFHGKKDGSQKEAFRGLFGSEFGSNRGHGFKPHRGAQGYWIWPTVIQNQAEIAAEWKAAAQRITDKYNSRGTVPPVGAP